MAVDSPWCYAVSTYLLCYLRTFSLPKDYKIVIFWSGKYFFALNQGSRQVIMALIYWDTPVLQQNEQFVALFYKKANQKNVLFFGFSSATRGNEDGIISNRGLACHGEISKFL